MYFYSKHFSFSKKKKSFEWNILRSCPNYRICACVSLVIEGWSQKSHPKDGPRKGDTEGRNIQQIQPEPSVFQAR